MPILRKLKQRLLGPPKTAQYSQFPDAAYTHVRDLPLFTFHTIRYMLVEPTVRLGLAMRRAPLQQAEFAYQAPGPAGELQWVPGVKSERPEVSRWILAQLHRIWKFDLHKILSAQVWGWSAGEVTWRLGRDNLIYVDRILARSARDVFALKHRTLGKVVGVRFHRIGGGKGQVDLMFPACFWHVFNPEAESPYGVSILKGSHSPWADKWLNGGALDVRRLFAHKDAYGGMDIGYPSGTTNIEGKGEVPNRDIARELVEQAKAGAVVTRPSDRFPDGQEAWPINRATIPANPTHIFNYPKDLDVEMLRGMEIPDDIVVHQGSGAWQGKQVPMQAFFTSLDIWLAQVIEIIVTQILEPAVMINWGSAIPFEVETKPLGEQAMEQMKAVEDRGFDQQEAQQTEQAGEFIQFQRGGRTFMRRNPFFGRQQMSLSDATAAEVLVGQGVLDASKLIEAGRKYLDNGNNQGA